MLFSSTQIQDTAQPVQSDRPINIVFVRPSIHPSVRPSVRLSFHCQYMNTFINWLWKGGRTNGQTNGWRTDRHDVYRTITFNRSCNMLKVIRVEKTAHGAKRMPKHTTISNSNSTCISILGIPVTFSQHNGKCNSCAFHGEIHAFEDWIFCKFIKSCSCFWMDYKSKKVCYLIDRFRWIYDVEGRDSFCPLPLKRGNL